MADLRVTGVTNNQLELQAPDGTRHYLEISSDLLKAMKSKPADLPSTLTPREIQAEIRLGTSVAELVARTGADEDQVAKFAAPIITELKHIVTLARNIRLSLAGDRFTDPAQIEFGTVMDERLASNSATQVNWSSRKTVEGVWFITASYQIKSQPGEATWSFDPKNLFLVPENQSALLLSNASPLSLAESSPVASHEPIRHPTVGSSLVDQDLEAQPPTGGLSIVPELVEESSETVVQTEIITIVETETRTTFHVVEDVQATAESQEDYDHPSEEVQTVEEQDEFAYVQQLDESPVFEDAETPTSHEPEVDPPKIQSTSRWAEVLFGSKDEDEEK